MANNNNFVDELFANKKKEELILRIVRLSVSFITQSIMFLVKVFLALVIFNFFGIVNIW